MPSSHFQALWSLWLTCSTHLCWHPDVSISQHLQAMAEQAHQACLQLERDLRQELRGKNFYEPSVRLLRQQLCSAYEAVLLQHYAVAQVRRSCKRHRRCCISTMYWRLE